MEFLQIILMFVSVVLIILSLLQGGKSDGLSSAFTGAGDLNLFANTKERGAEKVISKFGLATEETVKDTLPPFSKEMRGEREGEPLTEATPGSEETTLIERL